MFSGAWLRSLKEKSRFLYPESYFCIFNVGDNWGISWNLQVCFLCLFHVFFLCRKTWHRYSILQKTWQPPCSSSFLDLWNTLHSQLPSAMFFIISFISFLHPGQHYWTKSQSRLQFHTLLNNLFCQKKIQNGDLFLIWVNPCC